jgi:hypothetical protein
LQCVDGEAPVPAIGFTGDQLHWKKERSEINALDYLRWTITSAGLPVHPVQAVSFGTVPGAAFQRSEK